jgi:hypothetical protein
MNVGQMYESDVMYWQIAAKQNKKGDDGLAIISVKNSHMSRTQINQMIDELQNVARAMRDV